MTDHAIDPSRTHSTFLPLLQQWARLNPEVKRGWIFGSYAYGVPTPESDIDIAIEIVPACSRWGMLSYWIGNGDRLQASLRTHAAQQFPGLLVNVELYHRYYGIIWYRAVNDRRIKPAFVQRTGTAV